jgi:hypothetical protein
LCRAPAVLTRAGSVPHLLGCPTTAHLRGGVPLSLKDMFVKPRVVGVYLEQCLDLLAAPGPATNV